MTRDQSSPAGVLLGSVLTCPHCGHTKREDMPVDACQFFYECENCKTLLRPKPGDCCVFCSFGSVKCPPVRAVMLRLDSRPADLLRQPMVERRCTGSSPWPVGSAIGEAREIHQVRK